VFWIARDDIGLRRRSVERGLTYLGKARLGQQVPIIHV
jgi:hypothetical protein